MICCNKEEKVGKNVGLCQEDLVMFQSRCLCEKNVRTNLWENEPLREHTFTRTNLYEKEFVEDKRRTADHTTQTCFLGLPSRWWFAFFFTLSFFLLSLDKNVSKGCRGHRFLRYVISRGKAMSLFSLHVVFLRSQRAKRGDDKMTRRWGFLSVMKVRRRQQEEEEILIPMLLLLLLILQRSSWQEELFLLCCCCVLFFVSRRRQSMASTTKTRTMWCKILKTARKRTSWHTDGLRRQKDLVKSLLCIRLSKDETVVNDEKTIRESETLCSLFEILVFNVFTLVYESLWVRGASLNMLSSVHAFVWQFFES